MIIDMEYTDWNQNIDIDKILADMHTHKFEQVTHIAFQAILVKIGFDEEKSSKLNDLYQVNMSLNILLIVQDIQSPKNHFQSIILGNLSPLVAYFKSIVSELNLFKLSIILESVNETYPMLLATCLYLNKLDIVLKNQHIFERMNPSQIEQIVYGSISKN